MLAIQTKAQNKPLSYTKDEKRKQSKLGKNAWQWTKVFLLCRKKIYVSKNLHSEYANVNILNILILFRCKSMYNIHLMK